MQGWVIILVQCTPQYDLSWPMKFQVDTSNTFWDMTEQKCQTEGQMEGQRLLLYPCHLFGGGL
jgi:hypothetical protein